MHESALHHERFARSERGVAPMAALSVYEFEHDGVRISIPRPEIHVIVRFGPTARSGLDVHVLGVRQTAHRKLIRRGHRTVTARLPLGTSEAVLGVPAPVVAGRIVPLEELWGDAQTGRLCDRLAGAADTLSAAAILENAIAERLAVADSHRARAQLAVDAADRLTRASLKVVASDLGLSERHLRRVFHDAIGIGPKTFTRLARFHRALHAARKDGNASWARIAAAAGYYDQAHLIADFRAISGVTPRALLGELRGADWSAT